MPTGGITVMEFIVLYFHAGLPVQCYVIGFYLWHVVHPFIFTSKVIRLPIQTYRIVSLSLSLERQSNYLSLERQKSAHQHHAKIATQRRRILQSKRRSRPFTEEYFKAERFDSFCYQKTTTSTSEAKWPLVKEMNYMWIIVIHHILFEHCHVIGAIQFWVTCMII